MRSSLDNLILKKCGRILYKLFIYLILWFVPAAGLISRVHLKGWLQSGPVYGIRIRH